ncbi:unnamed protein product [Plutella xylostella]|uniref:(diamondback moth) hypothetical protein n=1 Tax=Plutella xylostella TaxID=51655 RepID=A0A8S4G4F7_PLUXY|nr:unnamed protein product [Plutella xylostella]
MNPITLNFLLDDGVASIAAATCEPKKAAKPVIHREPLTTKKAVEYLLNGSLQAKVCRFCLNVTTGLSEVGQYLQVANSGTLYNVTVKDMFSVVYPFQVTQDKSLPDKICKKCLDHTIGAYLFAQQCERSERALQNCLEDVYEKLDKLDPIGNNIKKRGRKKIRVNHDTLFVAHKKVIDYAEPMYHLINRGSAFLNEEEKKNATTNNFECPKCWQVLPNTESLLNHEKTHPATMWFHCRLCGSSFFKLLHLKKHKKTCYGKDTLAKADVTSKFQCKECGFDSETYLGHLQHVEKHKFKKVLDNILVKKVDLCAVCLDKDKDMSDLNKVVSLHGACPELTGNRNLYDILGSTLPHMIPHSNIMGTKICKKCLDTAIASYVFIYQSLHTRNRLNKCITAMLDTVYKVKEAKNNVFIEVSDNLVMNIHDIEVLDNDVIVGDDVDESSLKCDVLEDEFRIESSSDTDDEIFSSSKVGKAVTTQKPNTVVSKVANDKNDKMDLKRGTKVYTNKAIYNGFKPNRSSKKYDSIDDVCREFLTFKKKRKPAKKRCNTKFTCPICDKRFISEYFLKTHALKHVNKKVSCKVCPKTFKNKFYLREHVKVGHLIKDGGYFCNVCGRSFTVEDKMAAHRKTHERKLCQLCDKTFRSQMCYNNHLQRHVLRFKIYNRHHLQSCSFCEMEFWSENQLLLHVNKSHLQIKPYHCDMCDSQFYTDKNLVEHKKVHSLVSKEKCEFCDEVLKCRRDLVLHIKKHIC